MALKDWKKVQSMKGKYHGMDKWIKNADNDKDVVIMYYNTMIGYVMKASSPSKTIWSKKKLTSIKHALSYMRKH